MKLGKEGLEGALAPGFAGRAVLGGVFVLGGWLGGSGFAWGCGGGAVDGPRAEGQGQEQG